MPTEDLHAVIIWFAGLLLVLLGILMFIARLAVSRHTGSFEWPWRRGVVPLLSGLALLSVAMYLLGVRSEIQHLWLGVAIIAVLIALIKILR